MFDEEGNPVIATSTDVNVDPSSIPTANAAEGGDPSSPEDPHGRKPNAEKRIGDLIAKNAYLKGQLDARSVPVAQAAVVAPTPTKDLDPNDFNNDADYLKAVAADERRKIKAEFDSERAKAQKMESQATINRQYSEARKKYADFDSVALSNSLPVSQTMFDAAMGDSMGDILYALGENPAEALRIFNLHPVQQIKEIGKIESRLTTKPAGKITGAPTPPLIVGGGGNPPAKKEENMSFSEKKAMWDKQRKEELEKRYG